MQTQVRGCRGGFHIRKIGRIWGGGKRLGAGPDAEIRDLIQGEFFAIEMTDKPGEALARVSS
jgi:hypothetical protein